MVKMSRKAVVVAGLLLGSVAAHAQFAPGMSLQAVKAEVAARKASGQTAAVIARAACAANVQAGSITSELLAQGLPADLVISSVIQSCGASAAVVNAVVGAANLAGVPGTVISSAAIAGGAPVDLVTQATAAGTPGGGVGNPGLGAGVGQAQGVGFQSAPRPSFVGGVGGGGGSSVSRS